MVTSTATYTAVWNALDYPACVFPVTRVDPVLDAPRPPHDFIDDRDKENYEYCEQAFSFSRLGLLITTF